MNIEIANKLFEGVAKKFDTPEIVKYKIGDEVFDVEIYSTIEIRDKKTLIEAAYIAATMDEEDSDLHRDHIISSVIIEYLTNIPVPKITGENGEMTDLVTCYEIVFGIGGIGYLSSALGSIIADVQFEVQKKIEAEKIKPVDQLAIRILELIDLAKYAVDDIKENPATQAELLSVIEGMKKSDE